jgi:hypothetical protein
MTKELAEREQRLTEVQNQCRDVRLRTQETERIIDSE